MAFPKNRINSVWQFRRAPFPDGCEERYRYYLTKQSILSNVAALP
jgi:hypothetical protein